MPQVPLSPCPHCGAPLDGATFVENDDKIPEKGDVSVCIYCARVSIFEANGDLRKPTPEEHQEIANDPTVSKAVHLVKRHGPRDPGRRREA